MRRKNTAEAFEILLEMAEEGKRKRLASAEPAADGGPGAPVSAAPGAHLHIVERAEAPAAAVTPPSPAIPAYYHGPGRLRRDPLLRAPPASRSASRRTPFPGREAAPFAPAAGGGGEIPCSAAPVQPGAARDAARAPVSRSAAATPAPAAAASTPATPMTPPAATPATTRPARKGLGRWLSRGGAAEESGEESHAAGPEGLGGRFGAGEGAAAGLPNQPTPGREAEPASAAASADGPAVAPEEFLSREEREALAGGWGLRRRPSIDPEILRSLGDAQRFHQEPASARAPVTNETRLLEPREPPSRFGPGLWDPGESGQGRAGSSSAKPAAGGPAKGASGPAKRSRGRKGGGADRSRPSEDPHPAWSVPGPVPALPDPVQDVGASGITAGEEPGIEPRAGPWDSRDAAGPGMPPHAVEAAVRLPPPAPLPATPPASPLEAPSPTGATHPAAPQPGEPRAQVPVVVGRALSWMSGIRAVTALERRIELKISTMMALALSGAIILVLILTYLRLPPKEDALLASFLPDPGRIVENPGRIVEEPRTAAGNEEGERRSDLRSLPLWSPNSAPPGEPILPAPSTAKPDLRNVESLPGADATSTEPPSVDSPAAGGGTGGEPSRERFVYLIQVRGKENMEGARRILDYLLNFGFDRQKTEPDPRGVKNSEGKPYYTVFVGPYEDRAEADRECSRLKRLTREHPFRNRLDFSDFFEYAFVIKRTESNDKARSAPPP